MSRFDVMTKTIHAEWWEEHETVTIKELTWGEQQKLAYDSVGQVAMKELGNVNSQMVDIASLQERFLLACIQSWTFQNGNGETVPVNLTNVRKLASRDGGFIMEEINALNPERDRDFPNHSGDGLQE